MKQVRLNVHTRSETGRGPSRRLRTDGKVPAVLYGKTGEPVSLTVSAAEIGSLLRETAGAASLIELIREGEAPALSVVQEVQRHPVKDAIIHIDFHEVSAKEEMETHVNIHLVGEAFGVKNQNGLVDFVTHNISVRCLPKDLPGFIEVDVSELKVGDAIHIKELPAYDGVTYLADPEQVVASCTEQKTDAAGEAEGQPEAGSEEKKAE